MANFELGVIHLDVFDCTNKSFEKSILDIVQWKPKSYGTRGWRDILHKLYKKHIKNRDPFTQQQNQNNNNFISDEENNDDDDEILSTHYTNNDTKAQMLIKNWISPRQRQFDRYKETLQHSCFKQDGENNIDKNNNKNSKSMIVKRKFGSIVQKCLNVSTLIVMELLKQTQESHLMQSSTKRGVITLRRAPTRINKRVSPAITCQANTRGANNITIQDIKFYADEGQELLEIFYTICHSLQQHSRCISRVQFKRWMHRYGLNRTRANYFLDHLMNCLSANKTSIEASDYLALMALMLKEEKNVQLQFAYHLFDVDEDGSVSAHDVFELLRMSVHEVIPKDFTLLCNLIVAKTEESQCEFTTAHNEEDKDVSKPNQGIFISKHEWQIANHRRHHIDIITLLTQILHQQFRNDCSPSQYPRLEPSSSSSSSPLALTTAVLGTSKAIRIFRNRGTQFQHTISLMNTLNAMEQFTKNEIQSLFKKFHQLSNGKLMMDRNALSKMLTILNFEPDSHHYFFELFDSEMTNKITFETFIRELSLILRGSNDEKLNCIFRILDFDGSGCISTNELFAILKSPWGTRIHDSLDKLVDSIVCKFLDKNMNEAMISWSEFHHQVNILPDFWCELVQKRIRN